MPSVELVKPAIYHKLPKTIGPQFTKKVMPWVEQYWHSHGKYPDVVDFADKFGLEADFINLMNQSKFWLKALDARGIARPNVDSQYLSDRQIAAIAILTNFDDTRSPIGKLAQINVTEEELNGWRRNEHFNAELRKRTDNTLENVAPDATAELARQIKRGNFAALKFWFEITGRATSPEAVNVKQAMQILVEAVQKHVDDPATLQAIADEVNRVRAIQGV